MDNCSTYVAMDTHKKQHNVALLDRRTGEIRQFSVKNTAKDIAKMVKSIARQAPAAVRFCYEAGVCGFTLQRRSEANCPIKRSSQSPGNWPASSGP